MFNNETSVCLCVFASCWLRPMSAEQIYVATVTAVPLMCRWGTSRPRSRWTEEQISSERTKLWIHKYFPARTLFAVCLCLMHICNFHPWCPPQIIRTGNRTALNLLGCFSSLCSNSKIQKGFQSRRRGDGLYFCHVSHLIDTPTSKSISPVWQWLARKILLGSLSLPTYLSIHLSFFLFLPPFSSVHCVLLAGI